MNWEFGIGSFFIFDFFFFLSYLRLYTVVFCFLSYIPMVLMWWSLVMFFDMLLSGDDIYPITTGYIVSLTQR